MTLLKILKTKLNYLIWAIILLPACWWCWMCAVSCPCEVCLQSSVSVVSLVSLGTHHQIIHHKFTFANLCSVAKDKKFQSQFISLLTTNISYKVRFHHNTEPIFSKNLPKHKNHQHHPVIKLSLDIEMLLFGALKI